MPEKQRKKRSLKEETDKTIKSLVVTLASMIIVLFVVFLVTINENAEKGYMLEQQKLKNDHLKSENASITRMVGTSAAFSEIKESPSINLMEEQEVKTYVTRDDNKVR